MREPERTEKEERINMQNDYVIEMLNIRKEFPGIVANDDITLQLRRGEILGIRYSDFSPCPMGSVSSMRYVCTAWSGLSASVWSTLTRS